MKSSGFFCGCIEINKPYRFTFVKKSIEPCIFIIRNNEKNQFSIGQKDSLYVRKELNGKIIIVIQTNDNNKIQKAFRALKNHFFVKRSFFVKL
jgi:hypothetical protein